MTSGRASKVKEAFSHYLWNCGKLCVDKQQKSCCKTGLRHVSIHCYKTMHDSAHACVYLQTAVVSYSMNVVSVYACVSQLDVLAPAACACTTAHISRFQSRRRVYPGATAPTYLTLTYLHLLRYFLYVGVHCTKFGLSLFPRRKVGLRVG